MKNKSIFTFRLFVLTLAALTCSFVQAEELTGEATKERLTFPILFAARHNYQATHIYDTFYHWRLDKRWKPIQKPGVSGIYILENPADPPEKHRIRTVIDPTTNPTLGDGNYSDPELSYDAKTILFTYKGSPNGNTVIYKINVDGTGLTQLTNLDNHGNPYKGNYAGHHDLAPSWLPDGRIVFTSTRYSGLVPCFNTGVTILHVMNADGSDIHVISVNGETEFDPTVLPDGRILYCRWEYVDKNALVVQSLWSVHPDGTEETAYFANNLAYPNAILQARPVPGEDNLVVGALTHHQPVPRGSIAMIDISAGIQNSALGKNDVKSIFNFEHHDNPTYDLGQSCDPWALDRNVVLYSGQMDNPTNGGKFNSILLIDRTGKRVEVYSRPDIDLHNPTPLVPRPVPPILADKTDRSQTTGSFFVTDVYEGLKGVERGTVKWLRIIEETSRVSASPGPTYWNQCFSTSAALAWTPKIYHCIVPVCEDGSVSFIAPSGRAIYFQLLDKDYRLVRSMRTFIQAAPGTGRSCTGCHEYGPPKGSAGQLKMASKRPPLVPQDESWGSGYMDYPSMIQPIFDRKCVRCHGGEEGIAAGLDLSGSPTKLFNISYENLTSRREKMYHVDLISAICCANPTSYWSTKIFDPYTHGSGNAPLADKVLNDPTHKDLLTEDERKLLFTWIDTNGLYFGTWNYTQSGPFLVGWEEAVNQIREVMQDSSCANCHADENGKVVRFEDDWINFERPEYSRVLRAPMAAINSEFGIRNSELTQATNGSGDNTSRAGARIGSGASPRGIGACRNHKFEQDYRRLGLLKYRFRDSYPIDLDKLPTQVWKPVAGENDGSGDPVISIQSTDDPVYQQILSIIKRTARYVYASPRIDMKNAFEIRKDWVQEGRSRQALPMPIPDNPPKITLSLTDKGIPKLSWTNDKRVIGLIAQVHRGTTPNFAVSDSSLAGATETNCFVDFDAPAGQNYYAVVFICDPAKTCGTCYVDNELAKEMDALGKGIVPERKSMENRCPLSMFQPKSGDPIYVGAVDVPKRDPAKEQVQKSVFASTATYRLNNGYLTSPIDGVDANTDAALSISFDVKCKPSEKWAVLLSYGHWNSGWFIQNYEGVWRFHIGNVNCDSTERIPLGKWVHVDAILENGQMKLFQDGKEVASAQLNAPSRFWLGDLYIGQYGLEQKPEYQFNGEIRNLKTEVSRNR